MRVCDICRGEGVHYDTNAVVDPNRGFQKVEICEACWRELQKNELKYNHLAYVEVVKNRTGKDFQPQKSNVINTLIKKLRRKAR